MNTTLESIHQWFVDTQPHMPKRNILGTQIGVMIEEMAEVMEEVTEEVHADSALLRDLKISSLDFKNDVLDTIHNAERRACLAKELSDLIVTAIGVGQRAGIDILGALAAVNASNWQKLDDDAKPFLDEDGKIVKGPYYVKPDMTPFVGGGK